MTAIDLVAYAICVVFGVLAFLCLVFIQWKE